MTRKLLPYLVLTLSVAAILTGRCFDESILSSVDSTIGSSALDSKDLGLSHLSLSPTTTSLSSSTRSKPVLSCIVLRSLCWLFRIDGSGGNGADLSSTRIRRPRLSWCYRELWPLLLYQLSVNSTPFLAPTTCLPRTRALRSSPKPMLIPRTSSSRSTFKPNHHLSSNPLFL